MKKIIVFVIIVALLMQNVALASDNKKTDFLSYAVFENGEKVAGESDSEIYPVGSISKIFTSALVLKLCEEGKLSLDGKVCDYLYEFKMKDERYKDITVRHLLNHTSGLFGSTLKNTLLYMDKDSFNHDSFLSMLSEQRLKYNPGEMATYGNDGYTLLELLIEKVTGTSYEEYLHCVFDPLLPEGRLKTVYELESPVAESVNQIAAMGLYSDAETICKAAYIITSTDRVLNDESRKVMMSQREGAYAGEYFGLGWDNVLAYPFADYGIKALAKGGDTVNYHSSLIVLPEKGITACVISDKMDSKAVEVKANELILEYMSSDEEEYDFNSYLKPEIGDITDINELSCYEGFYISAGEQILFSIEGGYGVIEKLISGEKVKLSYLGKGKFDTGKGILYFAEINDSVYMIQEGYVYTDNEKGYKFFDYYAVKKDNGGKISDTWAKRDGNVYLMCDEKYTSLLYMGKIPYTRIKFSSESGDYLSYLKIKDDFTAECDMALPGAFGSDLTDLNVFSENGREYVKSQGWTYVSLSSLPYIYNGEKSICTILPDGYTRWFLSGEAVGKKIRVTINGRGSFSVYNSNTECIYSSLRESGEITVPENGYIAFSGDIGTVFEITLA